MFDLNGQTGILTRRVVPPNRPDLLGMPIGSKCMDGHLKARVGTKYYYVHRLVWAHFYGEWPDEIDHIDGDGSNNSLSNLRECSHSQNCHNRRKFNGKTRKNAFGVKGVFLTKNDRYRAVIRVNKKQIYLGQFKTLEEATAARHIATAKLVGEFSSTR